MLRRLEQRTHLEDLLDGVALASAFLWVGRDLEELDWRWDVLYWAAFLGLCFLARRVRMRRPEARELEKLQADHEQVMEDARRRAREALRESPGSGAAAGSER